MSDTAPAPPADRLFLAVDLDLPTRQALASWLSRLDVPGRRIPSSNWHLTLAFLGATTADARARLQVALAAQDLGPPFSLALGPLGAFPRAARAAVLWMGVTTGTDPLAALQRRVADTVRAVGLPVEERPFTPHLTVSRLRPVTNVRSLLAGAAAAPMTMQVDAVTLFRSLPAGRGTRYEALHAFPLNG